MKPRRMPSLAHVLITFGFVVTIAVPALAGDRIVALQSSQSGLYVRAGVTGQTLLAASSGQVAGWETFKVIDLGGGLVALQSMQNRKYVRAGVGTDSRLAAVSGAIQAWERFRWIDRGGGLVALQSDHSKKFVRAGWTQQSYLAAASPQISTWETFLVVDPSRPCSVRGRLIESGNRNVRRLLEVSIYDGSNNYLQGHGGRPSGDGSYWIAHLGRGRYTLRVSPAGKADPTGGVRIEPRQHVIDCQGVVQKKDFAIRY